MSTATTGKTWRDFVAELRAEGWLLGTILSAIEDEFGEVVGDDEADEETIRAWLAYYYLSGA